MIMNMNNVGKNIQKARNCKGLTQAQLADKVGVSVNHISRIETGAGTMSLDSLVAISNALETTPDYVLMGEYNITPDRAALIISEKLKNLTQDETAYIIEAADLFQQMKVNRK
jgi:transcriptional regulator with XRE-family HTH domain